MGNQTRDRRQAFAPPLKPAEYPVAMAFVANYPKTNFDVTYQESALFLRATYEGEEGNYCLAMPVTNDMAMVGGREFYGFPKKMADIPFSEEWRFRGGLDRTSRCPLYGNPRQIDRQVQ